MKKYITLEDRAFEAAAYFNSLKIKDLNLLDRLHADTKFWENSKKINVNKKEKINK